MKTSITAAVALLTLCTISRAEEEPEVVGVESVAIIRGSVDEGRGFGGLIVDAERLEHLWKTWEVGEEMPEVDFTRQFVVTTTWFGSRQDVRWGLLPEGRFVFGGGGTKDIRPGFRYTIGVFNRDGVRTVNGAALSKVEAENADEHEAGTGEGK